MKMETNLILNGDCIEKMKELQGNSVDAIITDPPYGLEFMGKEWDSFKSKGQGDGWQKAGKPSMEKFNGKNDWHSKPRPAFRGHTLEHWHNMQQHFFEFGQQALRILKPGGFMLIMGGTRTYHRMTCGIEDAGFEIRDTIMWLYGSGFPKSLNIGKQIDKINGDDRKIIGYKEPFGREGRKTPMGFGEGLYDGKTCPPLKPIEESHSEWEGWGTALKPAVEPIVVARKPLSEKNVALNVLKWGTGGINIDDCRIGNETMINRPAGNKEGGSSLNMSVVGMPQDAKETTSQGRFPANIILDEESGKILDEQSGISKSSDAIRKNNQTMQIYGKYNPCEGKGFSDKGGASRFFYCAKASKSERNFGCEEMEQKDSRKEDGSSKSLEIFSNQYTESSGNPTGRGITSKRANNHPTVKPIKLMEYLVKLVSKEGATVLDPFVGSGTTMIACIKLGRIPIGIEKEEEYIKIANARIKPFLEQTKINYALSKEGEKNGI